MDANCGGLDDRRPRHGDMLVRSASADTTRNAPACCFTELTQVRRGSHHQGLRPAEGDIRMEAELLAWR
jgi:hypothetical protein